MEADFNLRSNLAPIVVVVCLTSIIWGIQKTRSRFFKGNETCSIPSVPYNFSFIGNGLQFSVDMPGFLSSCYKKYGIIFKLKIFRFSTVIICDRDLAELFYKFGEGTLSLYKNLGKLYFADAFFRQKKDFPRYAEVIRKTVGNKIERFLPKMVEEADVFVSRLKQSLMENQKIDLNYESNRYVISTSSRCLTDISLTDASYKSFTRFAKLLNTAVVSTYFCPVWILKICFQWILNYLKSNITKEITPTIEKYRSGEQNFEHSPFLRHTINTADGGHMKNSDIGNFYVALLYTSSENSSTTLTNCLIDLLSHPKFWTEFQAKASRYVAEKDYLAIVEDPFIHACLLESARISTQVLTIGRSPQKTVHLGKYEIGPEVDTIFLCGTFLQLEGSSASESYTNPKEFNPYRFVGENETLEPAGPPSLTAWGGGSHLCPGKNFAIWEIKMALCFIAANFTICLDPTVKIGVDYFAPKSIVRKCAKFIVTEKTG
ncbi:probable lanosterol 14-alpha demethylase [Folsomia candida]|uniref:Lanosterol 14-alpha demethylase n=1 Tax=Folsomia candida TaxID=158441 RepID=A0A226EWK6_FOLCA|nr:probable lanosterol 14-alpha demethylase [Folsomia candida]OXA61558.1 putative lanosterol 14-alpha demethylase [Folsomia candida]